MAAALLSGTSIVLTGPLGSGKTHVVRDVAARLRVRGVEPIVLRAGASADDVRAVVESLPQRGAQDASRSVVVVDDAQDLDVGVVTHLTRAVLGGRANLLLALTRSRAGADDLLPAAGTALAMDLWLKGLADRTDLQELTASDSCALLRQFGGGDLDTVTRAHIIAMADGSRLLLRELTAEAMTAAAHRRDPIAAMRSAPANSRLSDALSAHLAQLSTDRLRALAVLGALPRIPYADACRVMPDNSVDDLIRIGLVYADGTADRRLSANPPLAHEARRQLPPAATDDVLSAAMRRMLSEADDWWSPVLARRIAADWHRRRRTPPPYETVAEELRLRVCLDAARLATDAGEADLGAAFARLGLRTARTIDLRVELIYADALSGAGVDLAAMARELDALADRTDLHLRWGRVLMTLREYPADAVLATCAARPLAAGADAVDAELAFSFAHRCVLEMRWEDAITYADRLAQAAFVPLNVRARAASTSAIALAALGRMERADAQFDRARRMFGDRAAGTSLPTMDRLWARNVELFVAAFAGRDVAAVIPLIEEECDAAAREGDDLTIAVTGLTLAAGFAFLGDDSRALRELTSAQHRARLPMFGAWFASVAVVVAWVLGGRGRAAEGRRILDLVDPDRVQRLSFLLRLRLNAESTVRLAEGDLTGARAATRLAASYADGSPTFLAMDLFQSAVLGDVDDMLLPKLRKLAETTGMDFIQRLLSATTDLVAASDGGLPDPRTVAAAWSGLSAYGVNAETAAAATDSAPGDLTRREREIALLIAEGLSNREIAERLYLSVRTVESHVFQARGKLSAASRVELGRMVASA
ncbi:LuxR C-terminal-related transcriptional regulator [Microbacterium sp. NPDC091313]